MVKINGQQSRPVKSVEMEIWVKKTSLIRIQEPKIILTMMHLALTDDHENQVEAYYSDISILKFQDWKGKGADARSGDRRRGHEVKLPDKPASKESLREEISHGNEKIKVVWK